MTDDRPQTPADVKAIVAERDIRFIRLWFTDILAMPDPTTFAILPWRPEEQGVGRLFCDVLTPERTPYEGDPRHVLRRALDRASSMGFDTFNVGPELEYFYFRNAKST